MQYQTNYPYATTSQQYGAGSHTREEQRRRQQEYSQALAQQVAQREEQKRREREMDKQYGRRNNSFQNPPQQVQQTRQEQFGSLERGILGGLGHNNPQNSRKSFARGQPQLHHQLPGPKPLDYSEPTGFQSRRISYTGQQFQQPPVNNQGFQGGFGFPSGPDQDQQHQPMQQQNWQQQPVHNDPYFIPGPGPNIQAGWPQQNPPQGSMSQMRNSQFWPGQGVIEQVPPIGGYGSPQRLLQNNMHPQIKPPGPLQAHNGGRRQQPDIHNGGRGNFDENEKLRKIQQQQEMQLALERQIEEKRQQKLEAKRRQEEEDRREMERFEEEQRRQRAEQERIQEEKRRKAELEQQKADQAAAAVAAANQQAKLQQQQKLHAQINQTQFQHPQPFQQQQQQQPERFMNAPAPNSVKNPFTNSRAHLFEDPPPPESPQRGPMPSNNQFGFSNQNTSPVRGRPQNFGQSFQHKNNVVGPSVDPMELRRQYDDMREELRRQKQLVDQLRQAQAQIQHQQQQPSPVLAEDGNIPTLMDLEKLRNELRGELEYREQLHRQELASLKREQQQERSIDHSPHRYPVVKKSRELEVRDTPHNVERAVHHPIADREAHISSIEPHHEQQRNFPIAKPQTSLVGTKHLVHLEDAPLNESLMSLCGESKFVYFDGRVAEDKTKAKGRVVQRDEVLEEEHDGEDLNERNQSPQIRRSTQKNLSPAKPFDVKSSMDITVVPSPNRKENQEDVDADSENDEHEFVVARTVSSPSHSRSVSSSISRRRRAAASSDRYSRLPSVTSSSTKNDGKWRLESMGTNDASDSDDDLDASLDGEQLEALFQRNVRRHEILLGFQNKVQQDSSQIEGDGTRHSKLAWAELNQQLMSNRRISIFALQQKLNTSSSNDSNHEQMIDADNEAALVASSRWMPSSLFLSKPSKI